MLPSLRCHSGVEALIVLFFVSCSAFGRSSRPNGSGAQYASGGNPCWERMCNCGGRLSAEVNRRHRDRSGSCRWSSTGQGGSGGEYDGYGGTFFTECRRVTPNDALTDGSFTKWCRRP